MPGTGKSSVIILLIKILIHLNKKILLVCYTNLAITNILDKLKTVRAYRACKENINFYSVKEIETYFKNIDLVASTCFGFKDPIFIKREFDFCIIDEGSQQHLLLTLIPISLCKKFVIFGDHLQLKPLVKASKELNTSLFEYLLDDNHSKLCIQYRMGANIMKLSNTLFYDGLLQSGIHYDDEVIFIDSKTIDHEAFIKKVKNTTILCYLNSQVKKNKELTNCQVETIDRFQGSESDNVIVIFDPVIKCDVYESKERLNVALTRAKKSLILLGDKEAMYEIEILRQLLSLLNI
ncbi:dna replication helicase [Vairimorpha apis BRL 01]|uniref:Dna replication helicase n=1 Tax=Vairimorpha apis BRL 01 TaxID=1037528 RepID=T0L0D1_9MICR|nr:dna replication helicase [Vairimorpha apis BRL 01]